MIPHDADLCPDCHGSSYAVDPEGDHVDCETCGGTGTVTRAGDNIPPECQQWGCGDVIPECAHKRAAREDKAREAGR